MNCTLCGTANLPLFYTQGDRRQYRFYRCPGCRLVVYDASAGVNQAKYVLRAVAPEARTRQNRGHRQTYAFIKRYARPPGRMLDLGCGDGTLLYLARRDGWEVQGVELFPEQAQLLRDRLALPVETADITRYRGKAGSHDVVVMTHVLEHLPNPTDALVKIRDLLAPRGIGVLEFPNIDALDARVRRLLDRLGIHRRAYAPTYVPGHVHEFCRASFEVATAHAGLRVDRWETYALNPLKYLLYRYASLGNKARVLVRRAA